MNFVVFTLLLAGQANQESANQESANQESANQDTQVAQQPDRPFHVINADIRKALQIEASSKKVPDRVAAIRTMARLHGEILKDGRYSTSDTLKSYRAKLWSRLTRIKRRLEIQIDREKKQNPRLARERELAAVSGHASRELASHMSLLGSSLGGPAHVFNSSGGAGGRAISDYGPELVDLIERTINPAFWDTNGGPGSIVYYAPLHALVVTATSEVHERIGGVVGGLRAAGN